MKDLETIAKEDIRFPKSIDYKGFRKLSKYLVNRLGYWVNVDFELSERITKPSPQNQIVARTSILSLRGTFYDRLNNIEANFRCYTSPNQPMMNSIKLESNYEKSGEMWEALRKAVDSYFKE